MNFLNMSLLAGRIQIRVDDSIIPTIILVKNGTCRTGILIDDKGLCLRYIHLRDTKNTGGDLEIFYVAI